MVECHEIGFGVRKMVAESLLMGFLLFLHWKAIDWCWPNEVVG